MTDTNTVPTFTRETDTILCGECPDWRGISVAQAIGHEHNRHDGAQTCWWRSEHV